MRARLIRQRALWALVESVLLVACAGYWFGNTGLGLALLWLAGPGRSVPAPTGFGGKFRQCPGSLVGSKPLWASERRLLLRTGDGRRIEIYRDEVTARDWAALKRLCLDHQLDFQPDFPPD